MENNTKNTLLNRVIFLDVDGVLNNDKTESRTPQGYVGVSGGLIDRLKRIVNAFEDTKIVLSSSWRSDWIQSNGRDLDSQYLKRQLGYKGLSIYDFTDVKGYRRSEQIRRYLESRPSIKQYVILDDEWALEFEEDGLKGHYITVDRTLGLQEKDVNKAIEILQK